MKAYPTRVEQVSKSRQQGGRGGLVLHKAVSPGLLPSLLSVYSLSCACFLYTAVPTSRRLGAFTQQAMSLPLLVPGLLCDLLSSLPPRLPLSLPPC